MARRLLIFDWTAAGHHGRYLRRTAAALAPSYEISVACPDALMGHLDGLAVEKISLGTPRPVEDPSLPMGPQHAALANAELALLEKIIEARRPDHTLHMYADPVLRWLVDRPALKTRLSLLMFFPRWHYRKCFEQKLPLKETVRARFQWLNIERWRRRADAHSILLLDEFAVAELNRSRRAPRAVWFPEPPIASFEGAQAGLRNGVVLYGSLARRKGIDRLAAAMTSLGSGARLILAGTVEPAYRQTLDTLVGDMRAAGCDVDLRDYTHDEQAGLAVLAGAQAALLPYPAHYGMSRVLVEAASVGTPVVAHDHGLIGHLVRSAHLGTAVDCADTQTFSAAIKNALSAARTPAGVEALTTFANRYSAAAFENALTTALAPAESLRVGDGALAGGQPVSQ